MFIIIILFGEEMSADYVETYILFCFIFKKTLKLYLTFAMFIQYYRKTNYR